jgi:predicted Zn finger-like uncharacterized protein
MSQNADCPYCGSSVPVDDSRVAYDEKISVRCRNCGGLFEYMPGFGSFSVPGEGPRTQRQGPVRNEGSYPSTTYDGEAPWGTEPPPRQQSWCGTCCTICCCCLLFPTIFFLIVLSFFGGISWLFG